jgi:hypothetical protein
MWELNTQLEDLTITSKLKMILNKCLLQIIRNRWLEVVLNKQMFYITQKEKMVST